MGDGEVDGELSGEGDGIKVEREIWSMVES